MAKTLSRPKRWADAAERAQCAIDAACAAITDLDDLKEEYEDWHGNLPENLQNSALGEKLQAVIDIDLDSPRQSLEEAAASLEDAASADLPRGFGKD